MLRWQAAFFVVLTCLAGCQGADRYFRYVNQPPGSGDGDAGVDGADTAPMGADAPTDFYFPFRDMEGMDVAEVTDTQPSLVADTADSGGKDGGSEKVGCTVCTLAALYWCEGTAANTVRATFSLVNETLLPIPLHEVTIRYWFSAGAGGSPWEFACDNGTLWFDPVNKTVVTDEVTNVFRPVSPGRPGADMYFEVGFTAAAGELLPNQTSLFRTRVYRQDYSTITQTDDYSFNPRNTTFGPWSHVGLYRNGQLVGGVEPSR